MKFDDVYIVDSDLSETEFIRRTYINLARNSYDPSILEGSFSAVQNSVMQVAGCQAHVDTKYKYDRIIMVTGTIMDTVQERYGRSWREKQVPREAQIPQHIPETGETSGDVEGCVLNMKSFAQVDNPASYLFYMNYNIPPMDARTKRLADKEFPHLNLTEEAYLRSAKTACDIVNSMATLPDEYDNISFTPTYYVRRVNCYMVPYYTATYTYDSKAYTAKGFACGEAKVWNTCPPGISTETLDKRAEKKTGVNEVKYLFPLITWAMYVIALVLSIVKGVSLSWTFLLSFALYLIGLIAYNAASSRCNKFASNLQAQWSGTMTDALNKLFAKLNMRPLTADEAQEFSAIDFTAISSGKKHSYSDISIYSIFTLVVHIITLIVVLICVAVAFG
ncbi:MAG: hypothetical protein LUE27_06215 [Clostridia bacterium]|nr:hypothetical protein [Clostridia bacterium]